MKESIVNLIQNESENTKLDFSKTGHSPRYYRQLNCWGKFIFDYKSIC